MQRGFFPSELEGETLSSLPFPFSLVLANAAGQLSGPTASRPAREPRPMSEVRRSENRGYFFFQLWPNLVLALE
jgi:hypothetical protein